MTEEIPIPKVDVTDEEFNRANRLLSVLIQVPLNSMLLLDQVQMVARDGYAIISCRERQLLEALTKLAEAEQQIKLIQTNAADNYAAAENRTHKAEEKLEALQNPPWKANPDSQGDWWHWNGNADDAPFLYHVLASGHGKPRYFIQYPDSRWCDEMGGVWKKIEYPTLPKSVESILNPPAEQPEVEARK